MTPTRLVPVLVALQLAACGGANEAPREPVRHETPADEIMRIAKVWQATTLDEGLRSEPDPISVFRRRIQSTLEFQNDQRQVEEQLDIEESFELRNGDRFECRARAKRRYAALFGRRSGEAAVQLERPQLTLVRSCSPPAFPEPELAVGGSTTRFVLQGDRLKAFEPPLDKRMYLPLQ